MTRQQLYDFAPGRFKVFGAFASEAGIQFCSAGTLPRVKWPDGHWCLEVNLFLLSLLHKGRTHDPRGGTLGTYASQLSDLIRFCFAKKSKSFCAITDGDFSLCVERLRKKNKRRNGALNKANNRTTVLAIASVWLDFLSFVGELVGRPNFVSKTGSIRAYYETAGSNRGRRERGSGWRHTSLVGSRDPYNYRSALSDRHLRDLREAAVRISRSRFKRRRRLVMLELFDTVGLRRIEAGWMKVGAVRAAVREWNAAVNPVGAPAPAPDSKPTHATISFRKAKSNGPEDTREVPISSVTLRYLDEYVSSLKRLMSRLRLPFSDETPLFPNLGQGDSRGEAVQPGYFTLEFHLLAKAAGITVPCSPHTARHRYIVKELIRLILSHNIENTDDFRRALLDSKVFVTKLRQLTGHASEEGLKPYIQQAFEELANLKSVLRRVDAHRGVEALEAARERFWLSLDGAEDPMQAGIELAKAVEAYQSAVVVFSDR